ncbi:MAG: peptidoglycan-binding protein, partial [Desulfobulbaceae bacterium]|nr:peptidoglycan-binding protein [Desulfobulbaceae bacterium]
MKLQGRELSEGLEGNDVQRLHQELALLGYEIRRSELQEKIFGADTKEAVNDFQRKRGFEPTGVVDPQTARLINAAVDALPPRKYLVKGKVKFQDGSALD